MDYKEDQDEDIIGLSQLSDESIEIVTHQARLEPRHSRDTDHYVPHNPDHLTTPIFNSSKRLNHSETASGMGRAPK